MDNNSKSDNAPIPQGATSQPKKRIDGNPPYGEDVRIAGDAPFIDGDAAALAHRQPGLLAELIARKIIAERRGPPPGMAGE